MTRELRRGKKSNGLVLANGGFLTHEHAIVLSNKPPHGFGLPLNEAHHHVSTVGVPVFDEHAEGESVIEVSGLRIKFMPVSIRSCSHWFHTHLDLGNSHGKFVDIHH
jgi:hypothetical protein